MLQDDLKRISPLNNENQCLPSKTEEHFLKRLQRSSYNFNWASYAVCFEIESKNSGTSASRRFLVLLFSIWVPEDLWCSSSAFGFQKICGAPLQHFVLSSITQEIQISNMGVYDSSGLDSGLQDKPPNFTVTLRFKGERSESVLQVQ